MKNVKLDLLEQFGIGFEVDSKLWKPVTDLIFQLLVCEVAILVIFKVVFVACGHVECQTGPFEAIWDRL